MIRNYFKTAWRILSRYKIYSLINIFGLALGVASCLIIFLVVKYELGYDSFNKKADRIYRVTLNAIDFNPSVSMAIAPAMRTYFPELEQVSQVWHQNNGLVTIDKKRYLEKNYMFADEHFLRIFDYEWLSGNAATALAEPNTVVLTKTTALKYFGTQDPMGQIVRLNNQYPLKVTGLINDVPGNTTLPFDFLVSFETVREDVKGMMVEFYDISGGNTFILAPSHFNIERIHKRIPAFITTYWGKDIANGARLPLQPLRDIHFDQRYLNSDITPTTSRETYWALAAVAIFILVIACINFVNLATAQAIRRAKEIGVRKVLGSSRSQLISQFLGETTLMVALAVLLGIAATLLFLPVAASWLDIKIQFAQLLRPSAIGLLLLTSVLMVLMAGLYPAFVQSSFKPVNSLKSSSTLQIRGFTLRKMLVVLQFVISQVMIVSTLVVAYQMDFFKNRNLGYDKEAVISIGLPDQSKMDVLRQQLISNPGVKEVSFASGAPAYNAQYTDFNSPELGIIKTDITEIKFIDERYTEMFKLHMLAGAAVTRKNKIDTPYSAVVNETLMQKLNIFDPAKMIGHRFKVNGANATVIGVVQDFQSESKHKKRRSCVLLYFPKRFYTTCIKLQPAGIKQTIAGIEKSWLSIFPDEIFQYEFLDQHIANWYRQEEKEYTAFKSFSAIAILIGCLGLYGLVSFAASQRIKEVGVRKVLGASLTDIVLLFAKEFVILIFIAFVIASPIAYFFMHNWLQDFAYQVGIGPGIFIIALFASFFIAGSTIAYQAIKAGIANPVKSLRTE